MKFACIMVTRGNPKRASAAIEIAKSLSSGLYELSFIVCADADDLQTQDHLKDHRLSVDIAPWALGELWNRGACLFPDADVMCPMVDDSFIATPDWDELIVRHLVKQPNHAKLIGWNDRANPGLMTLPIIGAEWYKNAGLYPGWFPYWFYDTWLAEIYSFVTGELPVLPADLLLVAKKGVTQRMRDLSFWWSFYSALRPERLIEAERLRNYYNTSIAPMNLANAIRYWETRDRSFKPKIAQMESDMTGKQMPNERYQAAKAAAEAKLAELAQRNEHISFSASSL